MILAALSQLYDRLVDENPDDMPVPGWNRRPVPFAVVLRPDGSVAQLADLRDRSGKKPQARAFLVPDHGQPRVGIKPFVFPYFLCDHTAFLLGARDGMGDKALEYFTNSRALHQRLLAGCDDPFAGAIRAFFATWEPAAAPDLAQRSNLDWIKDVSGANLCFVLDDRPGTAHESPPLKALWNVEFNRRAAATEGQCLVTGQIQPIARLHAGIKLPGTTGNGAPVVSFNADAFTSYGADQGLNAPVGERTALAYTAALNTLIGRDSRRKLSFGDTTLVFWSDRKADDEELAVSLMLGNRPPADDQSTTERVGAILQALNWHGTQPASTLAGLDPGIRFFVLGLGAPGGSRVSVRFWHTCHFGELVGNVALHHQALSIEPRFDKETEAPTVYALLRAVAVQGKDENIPGPLAAALTQAVLTGGPYPRALLALALERMRVEHGPYDSVSYVRAALVKACLARTNQWKPPMSLDPDDTDTAYRLGRLFAALERAQQLALGTNLNATIKDRYFGAASASPRAVFPNLLRLAQHHLSKAGAGWLDKTIGDIVDAVPTFPATLPLEAQGRFALGYYHQRNALWRKKSDQPQPEPES